MTPGDRRLALIVAFASVTLVADFARAEFATEPYVGLKSGLYLWPAYSNRDEVEADTGPGFAWSFVGGLTVEAADAGVVSERHRSWTPDRLSGRLEIEVGQRLSGLHGINDGPDQKTGDGKILRATSVQLNLWPSWRIGSAWHIYAGGGGGGTWIQALGSDKRVWSAQAGVGVLVDLPIRHISARLDLGWRSFFANSTKLQDAMADFDAHGGAIGLQLGF